MSTALTSSIDVAQVVLYAFWIFFFGLIIRLRREDHREGYPLESDNPRKIDRIRQWLIPPPKVFLLPTGETVLAPNFKRDDREIKAVRTHKAPGAALEPIGDPMTSNVGPAAWAERADHVELTRDGRDMNFPMRTDASFSLLAGPDPRGWEVVATDGKVAGFVKDIWVDRADVVVRFLEVALADEPGATRLLPITMLRLRKDPRKVEVHALRAAHFLQVPTLKEPERITLLEEEKILAFYAGGKLFAEPKRLGPVV